MVNLALVYQDQDDYAKAEVLLKQSLSIKEKRYGADHFELSTALNNLAALYVRQGLYAQAQPLFQRSLVLTVRIPLIADTDSKLIADRVPDDHGHLGWGDLSDGCNGSALSAIRMEWCPRSAWNAMFGVSPATSYGAWTRL